jgi:multidrug efflux pump subunit AcrA (membrane-fusion protein)
MVTIKLPDGSTEGGVVSAVGKAARGAALRITITLSVPLSGPELDRARVSVRFVTRQKPGALSVPTTALVATGGGAEAVREAGSGNALLPVTTGITADGYTEVSGPGIHQGLVVESYGAGSKAS